LVVGVGHLRWRDVDWDYGRSLVWFGLVWFELRSGFGLVRVDSSRMKMLVARESRRLRWSQYGFQDSCGGTGRSQLKSRR